MAFSIEEFVRLNEAAGPAEHWGLGDELAAFLGKYRDRLSCVLKAADALAEQADFTASNVIDDGFGGGQLEELFKTLHAYNEAKGGA